jgi:hypothetical protein
MISFPIDVVGEDAIAVRLSVFFWYFAPPWLLAMMPYMKKFSNA